MIHVVFDQTIEAVYTPLDSVVQSGDTRNGLPILLAEGAFGTAEVTLTPSSESPGAVGTLLECWEITLPEDRSDSHVLHYLHLRTILWYTCAMLMAAGAK